MAMNLSNVSTQDLEGGYVLVPAGTYTVQARAAEEKVSSNGNGMMYVEFEVIQDSDGSTDFEGATIKHWFVDKENDKGKNWGMITLKKFAEAAGLNGDSVSDSDIIGSMPVEIEVQIEEGKPYINQDGDEVEGSDQARVNPFSFKQGM